MMMMMMMMMMTMMMMMMLIHESWWWQSQWWNYSDDGQDGSGSDDDALTYVDDDGSGDVWFGIRRVQTQCSKQHRVPGEAMPATWAQWRLHNPAAACNQTNKIYYSCSLKEQQCFCLFRFFVSFVCSLTHSLSVHGNLLWLPKGTSALAKPMNQQGPQLVEF